MIVDEGALPIDAAVKDQWRVSIARRTW